MDKIFLNSNKKIVHRNQNKIYLGNWQNKNWKVLSDFNLINITPFIMINVIKLI